MRIDFSEVKCSWCEEPLEIFLCGGCDRYTCRECVHYLEHKCLHSSYMPIQSTGWKMSVRIIRATTEHVCGDYAQKSGLGHRYLFRCRKHYRVEDVPCGGW